ncbi:hypothetical protein [Frateuria sp. STR12]|uniref:hypothetical protein n=1 Tax=Frateuria hangzhouensis TaxID=2995589 RepID=UPI002260B367|nr:hypothetical protein [Frateuria sp. STR12]MCX7514644.1 hypothetical protein [Frateuria sp. STR12]
MNRALFLVPMLALLAPMAFAQQIISHDAMTNTREAGWGNHQAWINSMANLDELRVNLAQAWQGMGMSPQAAKLVADAYDPERAARMPHASLNGKSNQEVAQMMQIALKEQRYLAADQLLIDFLGRNAKKAK